MTPKKRKLALVATAAATVTIAAAIPFTVFAEAPLPPEHGEFVKEVVDLTNEHRKDHGCGKLTMDTELSVPAQEHSQDMADNDFMSHTGSDGRDPGQRVSDSDYPGQYRAENVAAGYTTPEKVVDGWMNSEGHRANILNCELEDIGVGYAENEDSEYRSYWTQNFGVQ
ncbi:CAP domain-containing protein [Stackebrandtia nassauensis]|uniref:SCP-like extracellular n=1 Tax=Stackebrandtia nassauensis (strain DSM 44728 / CIP 108903 / NRRL B-16338 / NBRC 102104 / LLR-40K-21) TaxID=446470 RepID=D3PXL4_STANL|nr:CAP domain-containing protein [Stackebrandtia nassauensis]ADD43344.1 SCP-like extracellular [Stackebrandtia nassauensis DSM 44728]